MGQVNERKKDKWWRVEGDKGEDRTSKEGRGKGTEMTKSNIGRRSKFCRVDGTSNQALTKFAESLHPSLQPHRSNSEQDTSVLATNVHNGSHPPEVSFFHPMTLAKEHWSSYVCLPPNMSALVKWHVLRGCKKRCTSWWGWHRWILPLVVKDVSWLSQR
ncbi:hypothetical protein GWK47_008416 [Chionoecetes opilio]|uniref:Uncharacterized protein n=1 Tax=Chionoecetes opilio TaxID=41210 RepID=A0A8J5CNL0_CHIOP|nr:hypothetical protein GWK47_008416 [Chionoecetes opilio]